jgi:hypothetical protein
VRFFGRLKGICSIHGYVSSPLRSEVITRDMLTSFDTCVILNSLILHERPESERHVNKQSPRTAYSSLMAEGLRNSSPQRLGGYGGQVWALDPTDESRQCTLVPTTRIYRSHICCARFGSTPIGQHMRTSHSPGLQRDILDMQTSNWLASTGALSEICIAGSLAQAPGPQPLHEY